MKPFNFNEGSREQTRREAVARARFHRWQAPGRSRVVHPAHGSIVVPHASNLAAILNAAEVWRCDWATILDEPGRVSGQRGTPPPAGGRSAPPPC